MIRNCFGLLMVFLLIGAMGSGCVEDDGTTSGSITPDDGGGAGSGSAISLSLPATDGTLNGSTELQNSNTEVSLQTSGTFEVITCADGGPNIFRYLDGTYTAIGASYTAPEAHDIVNVVIALHGAGSPTGNVKLEIYADAAGDPTGAALATSSEVDASTIGIGTEESFTFSTPYSVANAEIVHILLVPGTAYSGNGTDKIGPRYDYVACGEVGDYEYYSASWVSDIGAAKIDMEVSREGFSDSASDYVTYDFDGTSSREWDLSSFLSSENPNSEGGTITYDVGTSSDGTPAYTHTGDSLSALQGRGSVSGQHFHLKVNFDSVSGEFDGTVGGMSVDYQ